MLALVERAQQPDARLHCNDQAFHDYLGHFRIDLIRSSETVWIFLLSTAR